jgi:hypothetical protein
MSGVLWTDRHRTRWIEVPIDGTAAFICDHGVTRRLGDLVRLFGPVKTVHRSDDQEVSA